uniref:RanBP2-type domain-containing protein n=1 Tax=Glossina brevipalpis TaxID=37001 RepID=A0A1A9WP53_9MUSC
MSDFLGRDRISSLWDEILKRHWNYLEAEENIEKLEQRNRLEECFYRFLNIVEPDRKFFLPETSTVLRNSIRDLPKFCIDKALLAFDAISQYANNLYMKPWRKEFRILKMYSGFFQHVIQSCLLDVEKLFEAMGYSRVSDDLLVLDGPICPDQVANVSRDAMAAYVELQILKQILGGLNDLGLGSCWLEIYRYRESHVCDVAEAIENLSYYRNEDNMPIDNYSYVKLKKSSTKPSPVASRTRSRGGTYGSTFAGDARRVGANMHINCYPYPSCINQNPATVYNNLTCRPTLDVQSPHTSHYSDPNAIATLQQRNSFMDPPGSCHSTVYYPFPPSTNFYESPYEYLGSPVDTNYTYSSVAQTGYNVSGNRYPLPYNISHQFDNCNAIEPNYATVRENRSYPSMSKGHYDCSNNPTATCYTSVNSSATTNNGHLNSVNNLQRQSSYPPDQLIDFDEKNGQYVNKHSYAHEINDAMYCAKDRAIDSRRLTCRDLQIGDGYIHNNTDFPSINQQRCYAYPHRKIPNTNDDTYIYALPTPKENRTIRGKLTIDNANNREDNYHQMRKNPKQDCFELDSAMKRLSPHTGSTAERDMSDLYYESACDDITNNAFGREGGEERRQCSPTQLSKNQDGVGSFESWHHVFQKLQPNGHSKDIGDGDNMLMQSLDLDSLNLANDTSPTTTNTERRRSQYNSSTSENKSIRSTIHNSEKARSLEKTHKTAGNKQEPETHKSTNDNKKIKSALKQPNKQEQQTNCKNEKITTTTAATANNKFNKSSADNKTNEFKKNGNNNKPTGSQNRKTKPMDSKQTPSTTTSTTTQVIVTSPQEWSCTFCTFLNPNSGNICEICFHSKDFIPDTAVVAHNNAPTCV